MWKIAGRTAAGRECDIVCVRVCVCVRACARARVCARQGENDAFAFLRQVQVPPCT